MLRQKQRRLPSTIPAPAPSPRNLVNLMDVLKKASPRNAASR
jgi:hypothetical protein